MSELFFDKSGEYDDMLSRGLSITGNGKAYYMRGRVQNMMGRLPKDFRPEKIMDFGCGLGETCAELAACFPEAQIVGYDTAENALNYARQKIPGSRISFRDAGSLVEENEFDLCYVNGVFHHIEPPLRRKVLAGIYHAMKPGGLLFFFENNPWNPAARMVMGLIPFDRDAKMLSHLKAQELLAQSGFKSVDRACFIFYFPKWFSILRFLDRAFLHVPLGAQYGISGVKL